MVKAAAKCTNCGHSGHTIRTCNSKGFVKLFGVYLMEKKPIKTMENIQSLTENSVSIDVGNDSEGQNLSKEAAIETKKGKKWTEEEHQRFLAGMEKLGKGHWNRISKNFVKTKTPTQVASHAQKHFLRQQASDDKKIRSSIFDITLKQTAQGPQDSPVVPPIKTAKISSEASTSFVLTSNNTQGISPEAVAPAQVSNRFPHVYLDDSRPVPLSIAYPADPNYHGIQQMVEAPRKWQSFLENKTMPSPSFFPVMNYLRPNYGPYGYIPYTQRNFATSAPVTAHPSVIPSPQSFMHSMFLSGPGTSSGA